MKAIILALLAVYLALQAYDYATTVHRIGQGWIEKTGFVARLIERFGLRAGVALAKAVALCGAIPAVIGLYRLFPHADTLAIVLMLALDIYYARITYNNAHRGN